MCKWTVSVRLCAHCVASPILNTSSPVLAFGCVDLHASRDASLQIQNVSNRTLTFSLHLYPLSSPATSPLPFSLISSSRIILHPAETTTIAVSYHPALLTEDNALIIIEPQEIQHAPCVIPLVGFGGRSQPAIQTRGNQLFVTNNGDRSACFFVMGIEQNVVTLVKNSTFLPPIFYLPSMMEFSVKLADLRAEMMQKKVPIFVMSNGDSAVSVHLRLRQYSAAPRAPGAQSKGLSVLPFLAARTVIGANRMLVGIERVDTQSALHENESHRIEHRYFPRFTRQ